MSWYDGRPALAEAQSARWLKQVMPACSHGLETFRLRGNLTPGGHELLFIAKCGSLFYHSPPAHPASELERLHEKVEQDAAHQHGGSEGQG